MTTLYEQNENGIQFVSTRRPGEVRVPNYVYDMWLPVLGNDAIGVYSVYCRLEREGSVKGLSMTVLAKKLRMGVRKLNEINECLEECGFVRVAKPQGYERLMHWTTRIEVLDPPQEIAQELIAKYAPDSGYEPLCPWLTNVPEMHSDISGDANQHPDTVSDGPSNIATLILQPLEIEKEKSPANAGELLDTDPDAMFPVGEEPPTEEPGRLTIETGKEDPLSLAAKIYARTQGKESWTVTAEGGGADPWADKPVTALMGLASIAELPPKKRRDWARKLRELAAAWDATPEQAARAIAAIRKDDEHSWRSIASPYEKQFAGVFDVMLSRVVSGRGGGRVIAIGR